MCIYWSQGALCVLTDLTLAILWSSFCYYPVVQGGNWGQERLNNFLRALKAYWGPRGIQISICSHHHCSILYFLWRNIAPSSLKLGICNHSVKIQRHCFWVRCSWIKQMIGKNCPLWLLDTSSELSPSIRERYSKPTSQVYIEFVNL